MNIHVMRKRVNKHKNVTNKIKVKKTYLYKYCEDDDNKDGRLKQVLVRYSVNVQQGDQTESNRATKSTIRLKCNIMSTFTVDKTRIRCIRTAAASVSDKSAITDHVHNVNHDWDKVINWESDKAARLIRETSWIRKSSNMNQD